MTRSTINPALRNVAATLAFRTMPTSASENGISPTDAIGQIPLPVLAEQMVHSLLISYRANAALFRAIRKFAQESLNQDFRRKVARLEARSFERLVDMFLAST
ncbi:hypothetical protein [Silvibacterium dinghuense]|uniref:Uncharacterized protein n=1 Tax=Silvibacterium dinghuense TaxID=1560006 RepID=A0A4Q1SHH0_9BACT|nr:hypothetical protein [Silvibacterium dinghuense]RXS96829.1 hypothetical protein ESZ00_02460 [Silvibacterium dinghuense]